MKMRLFFSQQQLEHSVSLSKLIPLREMFARLEDGRIVQYTESYGGPDPEFRPRYPDVVDLGYGEWHHHGRATRRSLLALTGLLSLVPHWPAEKFASYVWSSQMVNVTFALTGHSRSRRRVGRE